MIGFDPGPLVFEKAALSTVPQPLPRTPQQLLQREWGL